MYNVFQDPLSQLKDLNHLKNQLEEIQRRVEDEVSVGIPQVRPGGLYIYYTIYLYHYTLYISLYPSVLK